MMVGEDDLGLSLSLGSSMENHHYYHQQIFHSMQQHQLNLMPSEHHQLVSPSKWTSNMFASSSDHAGTRRLLPEDAAAAATRPILKGIDMNRSPTTDTEMNQEEEEAWVSSPNNTSLPSFSRKRSERDHGGGAEELSSRGISDEDDGEGSRKKLRLSKDQSVVLEESFKEHNTLNPNQKLVLAKQLNLRPRQVEVWFQNRRARTKMKQAEVDYEYMKRCYKNLTEENRRLQKEVAELRTLKLSPQFYMQMTPPTTLIICPSCGCGAGAKNHHHQYIPGSPRRYRRTVAMGGGVCPVGSLHGWPELASIKILNV